MTRRFLLAVLLAVPMDAATVTGTGDTIAADGQCTLREAIVVANTNVAVNECTPGDIVFTIRP
jgi:CSLREA domain-containing protein